MSQSEIIVGGKLVPCRAPVQTWHEHGLEFKGLSRRTQTRAVINHWTGAENPPSAVFANMTRRRCSVHFVVDQLGMVWQFCDADAFAAHARGANGWSVGIEIISRGSDPDVPTKGWSRPMRREVIHSREVVYAAFLPAQIKSAVALNESLCAAYGLPLEVPMCLGEPYAECMSEGHLAMVKGCLAHYHINAGKVDCGRELLEEIHARGQLRG